MHIIKVITFDALSSSFPIISSAITENNPYSACTNVSRENVIEKFKKTLVLVRSTDASLRRLIVFFLRNARSIAETNIKGDLGRLSNLY